MPFMKENGNIHIVMDRGDISIESAVGKKDKYNHIRFRQLGNGYDIGKDLLGKEVEYSDCPEIFLHFATLESLKSLEKNVRMLKKHLKYKLKDKDKSENEVIG